MIQKPTIKSLKKKIALKWAIEKCSDTYFLKMSKVCVNNGKFSADDDLYYMDIKEVLDSITIEEYMKWAYPRRRVVEFDGRFIRTIFSDY